MQTIKTAAIVVLMLTVLYGGYVSLTTPPEPLPDEIQDILVIEEAGPGFPSEEHLASGLDLQSPPPGVLTAPGADDAVAPIPETGPPPMMTVDSHDHQTLQSADTEVTSEDNAAEENTAVAGKGPTFGSSFADLPATRSAELATDSSKTAPIKLPQVAGDPPEVTPRSVDSYASTESDFMMPDPAVAAASFNPDRGAPFVSPADQGSEYKLSDQDADSTATASIGGASLADGQGLLNAFKTADELYAKGQLKEALATLSVFYGMPNLSEMQRSQLFSRLDPLAREVIYSKRHLLEQPRRVGSSETLIEIAKEYEVPWQLLANINQVDDPITVLPGTELKTLRGPFRAEVDLTNKQMTMFLGDLYAGRFEIEVGSDPPPSPGTFTVQDKQTSHVYYNRGGVPVAADSPENPYGKMWLDLGGQICIHGSPNTVQPSKEGCISVAGDYADDVYGILSQGSTVTIRR